MVRELETNGITSSKENPKGKKMAIRNVKMNLVKRSKQAFSTMREESQLNLQWAEFIGVYTKNNYLYYYPFSINLLLILQSYIIVPRK